MPGERKHALACFSWGVWIIGCELRFFLGTAEGAENAEREERERKISCNFVVCEYDRY
jgi:hypothetical protein